jgi:hypothetical protein
LTLGLMQVSAAALVAEPAAPTPRRNPIRVARLPEEPIFKPPARALDWPRLDTGWMRGKRREKQTFAEMVAEEKRKPAARAEPRRPGLWGEELVDRSGRVFRRVERAVTPDRAVEILLRGGPVAVDDCGCGGWCGLAWLSADEIRDLLAAGKPHVDRKKGPADLCEFMAEDGEPALLITGGVRLI